MSDRTMMFKLSRQAAAAVVLIVGSVLPAAAQSYQLATASTGGTYYPVGVALATLVKVKLKTSHGITMTAVNSAGSGENIRLLRDNDVQFAILQGLFGAHAWKGTGPIENDGPQMSLRSIAMLWPNVEHFVVGTQYVSSGTIDDLGALNGKPVSMGKANSGTIESNRNILRNLGIDLDHTFDLADLGYGPSADALQNGEIEAMSTPAGPPVPAVTRALSTLGDQVTILGFTDDQLRRANGEFDDLWTRFKIAAGTYPGQTKAIHTIAQPNFLAVHGDVSEESVYLITKTIFENLAFLNGIHAATKSMNVKRAVTGLPVPLHPGAIRYYTEVGVEVPDRLVPN